MGEFGGRVWCFQVHINAKFSNVYGHKTHLRIVYRIRGTWFNNIAVKIILILRLAKYYNSDN